MPEGLDKSQKAWEEPISVGESNAGLGEHDVTFPGLALHDRFAGCGLPDFCHDGVAKIDLVSESAFQRPELCRVIAA